MLHLCCFYVIYINIKSFFKKGDRKHGKRKYFNLKEERIDEA